MKCNLCFLDGQSFLRMSTQWSFGQSQTEQAGVESGRWQQDRPLDRELNGTIWSNKPLIQSLLLPYWPYAQNGPQIDHLASYWSSTKYFNVGCFTRFKAAIGQVVHHIKSWFEKNRLIYHSTDQCGSMERNGDIKFMIDVSVGQLLNKQTMDSFPLLPFLAGCALISALSRPIKVQRRQMRAHSQSTKRQTSCQGPYQLHC